MVELNKEAIQKARKTIGAKLRDRRVSLGYSQTEVASTGIVARTTLSKIENGAITFSVDYLIILDELYTKLEEIKNGKNK